MSRLLPDVSLEEESNPDNDSSTELQNSRTTEEENSTSNQKRLQVTPNERPNLESKLGPYVSEEVDQALEEVYLLLRREFGGKASKSLIVEAALRYSLSDCLRRENESELSHWLERVLDRS